MAFFSVHNGKHCSNTVHNLWSLYIPSRNIIFHVCKRASQNMWLFVVVVGASRFFDGSCCSPTQFRMHRTSIQQTDRMYQCTTEAHTKLHIRWADQEEARTESNNKPNILLKWRKKKLFIRNQMEIIRLNLCSSKIASSANHKSNCIALRKFNKSTFDCLSYVKFNFRRWNHFVHTQQAQHEKAK